MQERNEKKKLMSKKKQELANTSLFASLTIPVINVIALVVAIVDLSAFCALCIAR